MAAIPLATYRLQFRPQFGFQEAERIVPYLRDLGMSGLYASPVFQAVEGSTHGYDVVDPTSINEELGGRQGFDALAERLQALDMLWVQDIVPNHMAFHHRNPTLADVLENGRESQFSHLYDVEWDHAYPGLRGRLLAPFLGGFYGETLENGEIRLQYDEAGLAVRYYEWKLPVRIESYVTVLAQDLGGLRRKLGREHPDFIKLLGILYVLKNLPAHSSPAERYDQIVFAKGMIQELYTGNDVIRRFMDKRVDAFNGTPGNPQSFSLMENLLGEQWFRPAFWKVATQEINYRRFFNINGLICLRVEDPKVFDFTHSLILELAAQGRISGLRVDHIDGLYDPAGYLKRLREKAGDIYLVVEKILDLDEELPNGWPVQGTTGYDFLNHANGVFCRTDNARVFQRLYAGFTGFKTPYEELVYEKKKLIIEKHMAGDVDNLVLLIQKAAARDRHGNDLTFQGLKRAVLEFLALFPLYRTYITQKTLSRRDASVIRRTMDKARSRSPDLLYELDFMGRYLLLEYGEYLGEDEKQQWLRFTMRMQQFTGPLTAKGVEDTALYIYNRLLSLNEVGGDPGRFGVSLEDFHAFNEKRAKSSPHAMSATATHDTKRGEDTRARLNVLSEIPAQWEKRIKSWSRINRPKRGGVRGLRRLDKNDEYFLYQTLVGAYPWGEEEREEFVGRMKDYVVKAIREAKVHTAWLKPDTTYEDLFTSFVEALLEPSEDNPFLKEFLPFQERVAWYGVWNSLSQTVLKIACPGVPDFYQGTELWDLSLVDPDNRRPVDYEKRAELLAEISDHRRDLPELIRELLDGKEDGRIKLFLIARGLEVRRRMSRVFLQGPYLPLQVRGKWKSHVIAFARRLRDRWALAAAPRWLTSVVEPPRAPLGLEVWSDTTLTLPQEAPSVWTHAFTGRKLEADGTDLKAGEIFEHFPAAILTNEETT